MITPPAHWTLHHGTHLVTLYPPGGGGRIRVYERIRPVRRLSELVAYVVERDPAFRITGLRDATEVITTEGEHGAWVRVVGRRDDVPAVRFVGAVFADEFALAIDTLVAVRDRSSLLEATSRELLLGTSLRLGVRRRRYRYTPPADWSVIPSGLTANWYPPDFPGNQTNLVVHPAEPSTDEPDVIFDRFLAAERDRGLVGEGAIDESALVSVGGLSGRRWSFQGTLASKQVPMHCELVAFTAAPYVYAMRLESTALERVAEHRELLSAVARSALPVPKPGSQAGFGTMPPPVDLFGHWFD
ncbi:MAG: hypothetical protein H6709_05280 [Kofleriaceae bacterium]|nr:hypothetical protein [Myxococcales bacterium]MCB9559873.1 hypothetical protein [Kofleriaceae bacterium]MCB9571485.1 hypothetical protein [Kofleriaceae bacterium]